MESTKAKLAAILIVLSLFGNAFLFARYFTLKTELKVVRAEVKAQALNANILEFGMLFLEKVLRAESEVSFEDRLQLENAVRDIGNEEILTKWEQFTESQDEADAQGSVKDLLEALLRNIKA